MSEFASRFHPEVARLGFECDAPPPDNQCHASAKGGHRYATATYQDWLRRTEPELRALLGDWQPDTERWWSVHLVLRLPSQGDGQNLVKPLLDLLSGSYVVEQTHKDASGRRISKGTVLKVGALWDDDRRVKRLLVEVIETRHATPYVQLLAEPTDAPRDWKAEQEQREREAREAERQQELAARTVSAAPWWWMQTLEHLRGPELAGARKAIRDVVIGSGTTEELPVTFTAGQWAKLPREVRLHAEGEQVG